MTSMSVAALRARYARLTHEARQATTDRLSPYGGVAFTLGDIGNEALEAVRIQWPRGYYDWPAIMRRFRQPDRCGLSLWTDGHRLLCLGLAIPRATALWLELVEGDPDRDAPLVGGRLTILLDAFANYAQLVGKPELRLEAKNTQLATLYEGVYGFERRNSQGGALYWSRRV